MLLNVATCIFRGRNESGMKKFNKDITMKLTGPECYALGLQGGPAERSFPVELNADGSMVRRVDEKTCIRSTIAKPCPHCKKEHPHIGHEDANRMSVSCECGARVIVPCPDEYPDGIDTLEALDRAMLLVALARWNMR